MISQATRHVYIAEWKWKEGKRGNKDENFGMNIMLICFFYNFCTNIVRNNIVIELLQTDDQVGKMQHDSFPQKILEFYNYMILQEVDMTKFVYPLLRLGTQPCS